jgi:hypothetical protein
MHLSKVISLSASVGIGAALVAGCFAALCIAVVAPVAGDRSIFDMAVSFFIYLPYSVLMNLLFGLPAFILLIWRNLVRWKIWLPLSLFFSVGVEIMLNGIGNGIFRHLALYAPVSAGCAAVFRLAFTRASSNVSN